MQRMCSVLCLERCSFLVGKKMIASERASTPLHNSNLNFQKYRQNSKTERQAYSKVGLFKCSYMVPVEVS